MNIFAISDPDYYQSNPPAQPFKMNISTINYCRKIFEHPDLTKIMGVRTCESLHLLHNEIKDNVMEFNSHIGGRKHGYLILLVSLVVYALLNNTIFVCQVHPGNLSIPIAATRHAQEKL